MLNFTIMKKRVFPVLTSGVVRFRSCGFLMSADVEVRPLEVIVTIFNGYSIMFATFHFRKSRLLKDPFFIFSLGLIISEFEDVSSHESLIKRTLCRMALLRLSTRSLDILKDSYKSVSEFLSR